MSAGYRSIIDHYESCFEKHGDTFKGVDWPNEEDALKRYKVMLGIIPGNQKASVLDFGCGTGKLLEYILENNLNNIIYTGIDISDKFIAHCKKKFPENKFLREDILKNNKSLGIYDYTIMNGVFTEKRNLSYSEMFSYMINVLEEVFKITQKGIAFNVMSKNVDWEREDLFHVPMDELSKALNKLSRSFVIRNDYGLYEYTYYLLKNG